MNSKDYLTNRNFCPIPWTGIMYNFDGSVKTCIRSSEPIGNIRDNSIEEIVHNQKNTQTRQRMLDDKPGERCTPCYDLEGVENKFDIISDRVFYLRELKKTPLDTYNSVDNFDLQKIDIRWTNLCNFSCVYCGPEYSSKWADELGATTELPSKDQREQFKEYIFERAVNLKHVYLAGGEPLLMKENEQLLELLLDKNPNVNLRINTNLSRTNTRVFNLICQFKNVHWIISAETMGKEYEYVRHGGHWGGFCNNLGIIKDLRHKITFNMLYFVLNIRHLPDKVLQLVKQELETRINESPGFLLENGYRNLLKYIQQPFEKNLAGTFEQLAKMDARRGVDSSKIFIDLYKEK